MIAGDVHNYRNPTMAQHERLREWIEFVSVDPHQIGIIGVRGNHDCGASEQAVPATRFQHGEWVQELDMVEFPYGGFVGDGVQIVCLPWPRLGDWVFEDTPDLVAAAQHAITEMCEDLDPKRPAILIGHCMLSYGGHHASSTSSLDASRATFHGPDTGSGERLSVVDGGPERPGGPGVRDVQRGRSAGVRSSVRLRTCEGSDSERAHGRPSLPNAALRESGPPRSGEHAGQHAPGQHDHGAVRGGDSLSAGTPIRPSEHEDATGRRPTLSGVRPGTSAGTPSEIAQPPDPNLSFGKDVLLPASFFRDLPNIGASFFGHCHVPDDFYVGSTQPTDWSMAGVELSFIELEIGRELDTIGWNASTVNGWAYRWRRIPYKTSLRLWHGRAYVPNMASLESAEYIIEAGEHYDVGKATITLGPDVTLDPAGLRKRIGAFCTRVESVNIIPWRGERRRSEMAGEGLAALDRTQIPEAVRAWAQERSQPPEIANRLAVDTRALQEERQ